MNGTASGYDVREYAVRVSRMISTGSRNKWYSKLERRVRDSAINGAGFWNY